MNGVAYELFAHVCRLEIKKFFSAGFPLQFESCIGNSFTSGSVFFYSGMKFSVQFMCVIFPGGLSDVSWYFLKINFHYNEYK